MSAQSTSENDYELTKDKDYSNSNTVNLDFDKAFNLEQLNAKYRLEEIEHLLKSLYSNQASEKYKTVLPDVKFFLDELYFGSNVEKKQPLISATEDGSEISLEWHVEKAKLLMSFYGDGKYSYYFKFLDNKNVISEKIVDDHPFLNEGLDSFFGIVIDYIFQENCVAKQYFSKSDT